MVDEAIWNVGGILTCGYHSKAEELGPNYCLHELINVSGDHP